MMYLCQNESAKLIIMMCFPTGIGVACKPSGICHMFNLGILLQAKLAVSFCWILPVPTSYLGEGLRRHPMIATE